MISADVDLVSTIPGRFPLPPIDDASINWLYNAQGISSDTAKPSFCERCLLDRQKLCTPLDDLKFCYGSARVKSLVKHLSTPGTLVSKEDHLIVQPTSIGQGVNNAYLASFLEDMMPEEFWVNDQDKVRSESWSLLWPSNDFVEEIIQQQHYLRDVSSVRGLLFLNSKTFALMEPDVQSQFALYEPNGIGAQKDMTERFTPHIKSYMRLKSNLSPRGGCSCPDVAWFLLTSACLSKGAQGHTVPYSVCADCHNIKRVR